MRRAIFVSMFALLLTVGCGGQAVPSNPNEYNCSTANAVSPGWTAVQATPVTGTSTVDSTVPSGGVYRCYTVTAVNTGFNPPQQSLASNIILVFVPSGDVVDLSWNAVTGSTGYVVYWSNAIVTALPSPTLNTPTMAASLNDSGPTLALLQLRANVARQ